jgi:hypothetical protein
MIDCAVGKKSSTNGNQSGEINNLIKRLSRREITGQCRARNKKIKMLTL